MALRVKDQVLPLATVFSLVSLALVFGAVLGVVPASLLPQAPAVVAAVPHLNAVISLVAIPAIVVGWRAIRNGEIRRHRAAMLTAAVLFAAFLVLYLWKVVLEGPAAFPGAETVYQFVYLPVLAIHILLAVVCVPLLYYVLLIGLTHDVAEIPRTNHLRIGRVAAALWLVSFVLGVVVYAMLYLVY